MRVGAKERLKMRDLEIEGGMVRMGPSDATQHPAI